MAYSPRRKAKGLTVPNTDGSASSLSSCQSGDSSSPSTKKKKAGFMRVLKRKDVTGKDFNENQPSSDTETSILVPVDRPKNFAKVLAQIRERAMSHNRRKSKTFEPPGIQLSGEVDQANSKSGSTSDSLTRGRSNTTLSVTDEETTELDSFDDTLYYQDEVDSSVPDSEKTTQAVEHLRRKIEKIKEKIKQLQEERDESVKEYLQSTDRSSDQQRVKVQFEKKNQKTNSTITNLQKKLEKYHSALVDLEENGASYSAHSSAKDVLRGVKEKYIRGLSGGVRDGVRGAVTKPLEIANLIKNKFGSSENISATGSTPIARADGIEEDLTSTDRGDDERYIGGEPDKSNSNLSPRYISDDDSSSLASATHISGLQGNPASPRASLPPSPPVCYDQIISELKESNSRLHQNVEDMKQQLDILAKSLQDERFKSEHLRCQLNDLTNQWNDMIDLHQNEMASLKQELERAEERIECVEYRSSERAGEIEDTLDTYVTRITKIENIQQQNQQMMGGGFDNYLDQSTQAKALLSKFLSVILAVLALVLIIFASVTRIIQPLTRTKTRLLLSIIIVMILAVLWRYQENEHIQTFHDFLHERLFKVLSSRMESFTTAVRQLISRKSKTS